ncbi:MAG: hypothetical protein ACTH2Y_03370 [Corynebacterium sp.]|uniref:hypothetical protein n=1 Tax=unclassified Corynebacterium TaxID=2624378 RepID=UPI00264815DF|nr:hypothetical protein [Corynebacterium sp.]MDN5582451.1 hypothetical protein [Corynebacterium sp.]MDN5720318.1 hypothetical protein [Corynebacterium sp.]MDN6325855.1 hypothetical protein [Corynebacterium sp.]MDN6509158.1 hypothetical protein [Corynebacterium sp.]
MSNQNASYTVTVVRDDSVQDMQDAPAWCAAVAGVEGAVVWGDDFDDLEAGVRAKLADHAPGVDPDLTWEIDTGDGPGSAHQTPLNSM